MTKIRHIFQLDKNFHIFFSRNFTTPHSFFIFANRCCSN